MPSNGHVENVRVFAPPAQAVLTSLAPPDEKLLLLEENRAIRKELDQSRIATRTLASVAVALARLVNDEAGPLDREILIPRDLYDKLAGAEVGVDADSDGNLKVRIRDNLSHPVWEGR